MSGVELVYEIFAPLTGIFCNFKTFHYQRVLYLLEFFDADNRIHPGWFKWDLLGNISWLTDSERTRELPLLPTPEPHCLCRDPRSCCTSDFSTHTSAITCASTKGVQGLALSSHSLLPNQNSHLSDRREDSQHRELSKIAPSSSKETRKKILNAPDVL